LYLVGTPIGTLEDITLRALRILRGARLIAAEDTRRARKLLSHYDIHAPLVSYREENHARAAEQILLTIRAGGAVALVSDAGMPCISDPGALLVRNCEAEGLRVEVIPGPSAVTTAIARAGIDGGFIYLGFPPARQKARREFFTRYGGSDLPLVVYEAPHRIVDCLADIAGCLGSRPVVACRELTKVHEEIIRGTAKEVHDVLTAREEIRGEFTLIVVPGTAKTAAEMTMREVESRYAALLAAGDTPAEAMKRLVRESGKKKKELYALLRVK
jgi:16S rRNA (cytidine1402-2'-O)-methyltransferase